MAAEPGLRERKKLKAMRHIQEVALDLFDEHGYGAVTIERVAAQAEVSPSSVYRYFGTKERIVLYDEYDPIALEALAEQSSVTTAASAVRELLAHTLRPMLEADESHIRRRMHYVLTEPDVRAGMARDADDVSAFIRSALAKNMGSEENEFEIRVTTAALVAGFLAAVAHWHESGYHESLSDVLDQALDLLGRQFERTEAGD